MGGGGECGDRKGKVSVGRRGGGDGCRGEVSEGLGGGGGGTFFTF